MGRRGVVTTLVAALLLAVAFVPGPARGERSQSGDLIGALNAGIAPLALPRQHPAPVAVHLEGRVGTADGSPLPQVKQIKIELAGPGLLATRGLAVCPRARLRSANDNQALERCGAALVGRGSLGAQVFIPGQAPFAIHAHLLAFNGRGPGGGPALWVHAFASDPPVSLVLPFVLHPGTRSYPTVLVAKMPKSLGTLPHLAVFSLNLFRRYSFQGQRQSYISATCPVPENFTAGFLSFARATYSFAGDRQLQIESVRSCRAS